MRPFAIITAATYTVLYNTLQIVFRVPATVYGSGYTKKNKTRIRVIAASTSAGGTAVKLQSVS